jgi:hypothetical protein
MDKELNVYWFTLDISFYPPLKILDENDRPTGEVAYGATLEIGVTEVSEQDAKSLALSFIHEIGGWDRSQYSISFDHIGILDEDAMQKEIYEDPDVNESLIQDPLKRGVWYRTGFGFYTDENE